MKISAKGLFHCWLLQPRITPFVCFLFIYFSQSLSAQVRNFGNLYISGNVYTNVAFTNGSTASYQNDGNFYLTDNFTNNQSSITEGTGTTSFIGTFTQKIFGAQTPVFHDVYLSNSAGLQLNISTTMGGTISPAAGSIYFNNYALTMGTMSNVYTNRRAFNVTTSSDLNIKAAALTGSKIYFDSTANTMHNLTVNSSASGYLGNALNIVGDTAFGTVKVNGTFDANGLLTLKSDSSGTAQVGVSNGTINNEVIVERYFPAIRAWRFVADPFSSSSQSINQAWQEGYVDAYLSCPPQYTGTPGYGTAIAYNNVSANGWDQHNNNYKPSIQAYVNNSWLTPTSTLTTNIADYDAYSLFVRGDRTVCLTYQAIPNTTTLRPKGVLNQFSGAAVTKSFSAGTPNGYVMIGNPYASSVNIQTIIQSPNSSGIVFNRFLAWNPELGGNLGVGGYITYSSGILVPANSGYTAGTVIQSSQAFMVQRNSSGSAGYVTFQETNKTSSQTITGVFGLRAAGSSPDVIYMNLLDTNKVLMDGVGAAFGKQFSASIDSVDAPKRWNEEIENMALMRNNQAVAIEFRPVPVKTDTLFCRLYLRQHPYKLQLFATQTGNSITNTAWIVDKYLGTQTQINLSDTTFYTFVPNTDTNSYRNRFMVVFSPAKPNKLVKLENFIAKIRARIYPNPVSGNTFRLTLQNAQEDNYSINIYTLDGTLAAIRSINYKNGVNTYNIPIPSTITSGSYTIQVINSSGVIVSALPLVINR